VVGLEWYPWLQAEAACNTDATPTQLFFLPSRTAAWNSRHDIHTGRCTVQSARKVTCVPRTVYSTICTTDFTHWPYDVVKCSLVVGAWMNTGEEITVNNDSGEVSI